MGSAPIPPRFRATPNDVGTAVARRLGQHMELGCRLAFDGRLDADVLRRAVRLSLDAEPVLGCSFTPTATRAWWVRREDLDAALPFSVVDTADPESDARRFQALPVDDSGPQVAVRLLRAHDHDEVTFRVSHVAADGQSTKQYAYLLAALYSRLLADPSYSPVPNLSPRPSSLDVWRGLTPDQRRDAKGSPRMTMPNWLVPRVTESGEGRTSAQLTIGADRFAALKRFGQEHGGATINDLLLTAFFRALAAVYPPPDGKPMSLPFSAEHRRYLSAQDHLPISNLAITLWLGFSYAAGEPFDATLARASEQTRAWRSALWGVKDAAQATRLMALGPAIAGRVMKATTSLGGNRKDGRARTSPVFTNIGVLDEDRLHFGALVPVLARLSGPAAFGASFVPTISTYRDAVTVSMGYCAQDMDAGVIDAVLSGMERELAAVST